MAGIDFEENQRFRRDCNRCVEKIRTNIIGRGRKAVSTGKEDI